MTYVGAWDFYQPDQSVMYYITKWDDGNQGYQEKINQLGYRNNWWIYGDWEGKVALVLVDDASIKINSISRWKLSSVSSISLPE